jgi:hypothetical protein
VPFTRLNESDQLGETLQRLQPLVSRVPILTAEKKQAKAKSRTAGGAAIHRINLRRSPADDGKHPTDQAKHNARWKGASALRAEAMAP